MSRANPIGLRLASKKRKPSFIGVGQYYSYNQLKHNIVIHKSILQLSKQLAIPAYPIVNRFYSERNKAKNLILYPNILPINVRLKAKQLFDSQYILNRRRFYSVAIYITKLLKQQFEKNYNDFIENSYMSFFYNDTRYKPFVLNLSVSNSNKYKKWKSKKLKICSLSPSVTFARAFFRVSQKPSLNLYDVKKSSNIQNHKMYRKEKKARTLEQTNQNKNLHFLFPTTNSDPYLILSYGIFSFRNQNLSKSRKVWQKLKEFYFLTKQTNISINGLNFNSLYIKIRSNNNPSASLLALNCKAGTVFTFKKPKSKHQKTSSGIISKTNNLVFKLDFCFDKNKNLNPKNQWVVNSKKHKSYIYLSSARNTFNSFFFQFLTHIKQSNSTNIFTSCPEWPLPIIFSPITALFAPMPLGLKKPSTFGIKTQKTKHPFFKAKTQFKNLQSDSSINGQSWKKHLSFIMVKTKIQSTLQVEKQEKQAYVKPKKKGHKYPLCKEPGFIFSKNQKQSWANKKEMYIKPPINYQIIKRFILLNYLVTTLSVSSTLYQKSTLKKTHGLVAVGSSFALAKEIENKQKRLHMNLVPVSKEEVPKALLANKISYTCCPGSSLTTLNLKNIKKLTKQVEHFRSDIKLLAPLELLLHRSFSEPVGINCISAVDNRLGKTYCNPFLKNLLFRRTSNNFLKSSYMDSQTGLLRTKNGILFDFAYTKDSLTKLGLKKTNTLMQQLLETGHTKLWLRKLSSVRL